VATWNVEWLDQTLDDGRVKRTQVDYDRLAAYARRLDVDVIALQEVDGPRAAARIFDRDEYAFYFEPGTHPQKTGFAVRKTIPITEMTSYEALKLGRHGLRAGAVISINIGGYSLQFMNVHMKSGCFDKPLPEPSATPDGSCGTLAAQLFLLEAWVDEQADLGVPTIVLGDFNRRLGKPGDAFWAEIDDGNPPAADLVAATEGHRSRCWDGKYPDYIDHIVFDQNSYKWYVPESFSQLIFDDADDPFEDVLSDHCPIGVVLTPPAIPKG
jgi:endonuclease/exonuclease/phosphatase family metal-dependent hydrolase